MGFPPLNGDIVDDKVYNALDKSHLKPLYLLIKVDVDAGIVYNQEQAEKYAENHCNSLEYALADWYYPDDEQYPYIAKWRNTSEYWQ